MTSNVIRTVAARIFYFGLLLVALSLFTPNYASAITEYCMVDGADIPGSLHPARTLSTRVGEVRFDGRSYFIPENYLNYPMSECLVGDSRGISMRVTLADFAPATPGTWDALYGELGGLEDRYVIVTMSSQILRDMSQLLALNTRFVQSNRLVEPLPGLVGLAEGPLRFNGDHVTDIYFEGNASAPTLIVVCGRFSLVPDPRCNLLFKYGNATVQLLFARKYQFQWRQLVSRTLLLLDKLSSVKR